MSNKDIRQHQIDIQYMKRALRLARKGEGMVSPNPLVGAVIVKDNQIIGEGYHQRYGNAHAEINAINSSSKSAKGSTLYCTLEPCCHTDKQTPPCVNRIIKEGFKRVVVASTDPNPKVKGRGFRLLQQAGIEVKAHILDNENKVLNKFYFKFVSKKLPYVTLKVAQSADGYIAQQKNKQIWLTGEKARRLVHRWRSNHDAVLIGANTLRVDDPLLTVRYGVNRNPIRIILCGSTDIDLESQIFKQEPENKTWIITTKLNHPLIAERLNNIECKVIGLSADSNHQLSIISVLEYLSKQKVTSVLIEGGQKIFSQFIQTGLWDELNILISPRLLGHGIKSFNFETNQTISSYHLHKTKMLGDDVLLTYQSQ